MLIGYPYWSCCNRYKGAANVIQSRLYGGTELAEGCRVHWLLMGGHFICLYDLITNKAFAIINYIIGHQMK